ncbi:MAG: class I SAM-dependent methyltransferase [Acidaminococcaceae bacterium]|nr:class I SAM-dependent methyltransferase [Acidaminococcaceae bacterium]
MNKDIAFFDSCANTWDCTRRTDPQILEQLLILAQIPTSAKVLDVGSGTGVLLPYLRSAVGAEGKITAVDFSKKMLAKAQEKFSQFKNLEFLVGDILEIELPLEAYDIIICLNFFPHLHTRKEEFVRKMLPALQTGGSLIIMHDISRETVNSIHRGSEIVTEHRLPEAKTVGEMLTACGYSNIHAYENDAMYFVKGLK